MGAVHPLADEAVSSEFPGTSFLGAYPKIPGAPGTEALFEIGYSVIGNLSLFTFEPGQYERGTEGMPSALRMERR